MIGWLMGNFFVEARGLLTDFGIGSIPVNEDKSTPHKWRHYLNNYQQTDTDLLEEFQNDEVKLTHEDVAYKATRASGKGGQKRNKVHTAVQLTHKKTGFRVDCCEGVSQRRNRDKALKRMEKRLNKARKRKAREERAKTRKKQVGSGMRGDKVRTIQCHQNMVKNHVNSKKTSFKRYSEGYVDDLH